MEHTETKENLPILVLLEENKKIVVLNTEHEAILNHIKNELKANKYNSIVTMDNQEATIKIASDFPMPSFSYNEEASVFSISEIASRLKPGITLTSPIPTC